MTGRNGMERLFEHTLNTRPILENSLRFVRSDVPARVSEAEKDALIERGITTIVDLRTAAERAERPCPLADDARFTYLWWMTRCTARSTRFGPRKPTFSISAPPERIGQALCRRSCSINPA